MPYAQSMRYGARIPAAHIKKYYRNAANHSLVEMRFI
jgi:hypothetical protein